jgi:antitoxin ParD1/3/4
MASSVNLGEQLEAFITDAVKNGRYGSRSEVLREGVRVIQEREKRLAKLDAQLARAVDDIEAGRTYDADEVFARLERKYRNFGDTIPNSLPASVRMGHLRQSALPFSCANNYYHPIA